VTPDALSPTSADLDIVFAADTGAPIERVLEALRTFRLVGLVEADAEGHAGSVAATLAYVAKRGLVVDAGDAVHTTPVQPILDALAARLGAEVVLDTGDDVLGAMSEGSTAATVAHADDSLNAAAGDDPVEGNTTVFVVGGELNTDRDRQAELALQMESTLTVAPLGTRMLIAPEYVAPTAYWTRAQRPVIALQRSPRQLTVQLYTSTPTRTGRMRDRLAAMAMPDWMALWDPAPVALVEATSGAAARVQADLAAQRRAQIVDVGVPDATALAETGIAGAELRALLGRNLDDDTLRGVLAALRLPSEVADVLEGRVSPADLPAASVIEQRGMRGAIVDGMLIEPDGDSFFARWRRLPHRRPGLALTLIAAELGLAIALVAGALSTAVTQPWTAILWVGAAVVAVDAVGDAVVLAKIRLRK